MNARPASVTGISARKVRRSVGIATALLIGAAWLAGCGNKNTSAAGPPPPLPVTVVKVEPKDVPLTGEWVGTLDGYVNAQIQPQASGYLIKQNYKEGAKVSKGEVLFEIDPRPFQAALDQAKGQLAQAQGQVQQAKAQLELAEINVKRDTPLAEARAIAQSQLDNDTQQKAQSEAAVQSAQATVAAAEAAVENAELNLGFTHVRSLITGIAGQATVQVGNLVNTQSVLTSVSQVNPIKAYFSISDSEYLELTQRARHRRRRSPQERFSDSPDPHALHRRSISAEGPHRFRRPPNQCANRRYSHRGGVPQSREYSASRTVRASQG